MIHIHQKFDLVQIPIHIAESTEQHCILVSQFRNEHKQTQPMIRFFFIYDPFQISHQTDLVSEWLWKYDFKLSSSSNDRNIASYPQQTIPRMHQLQTHRTRMSYTYFRQPANLPAISSQPAAHDIVISRVDACRCPFTALACPDLLGLDATTGIMLYEQTFKHFITFKFQLV